MAFGFIPKSVIFSLQKSSNAEQWATGINFVEHEVLSKESVRESLSGIEKDFTDFIFFILELDPDVHVKVSSLRILCALFDFS